MGIVEGKFAEGILRVAGEFITPSKPAASESKASSQVKSDSFVETSLPTKVASTERKAFQGALRFFANSAAALQADPQQKATSNDQLLRARADFLQGESADLQGDSPKATMYYQAALEQLKLADENSFLGSRVKTNILKLRAQVKHQMRDYQGAREAYFWLGQDFAVDGRKLARHYEQELGELADQVEIQAFLAQESGQVLEEAFLVAEAVKINQALGREQVVAGLTSYLEGITADALPQSVLTQAQTLAKEGSLKPELLERHEGLTKFVSLSTNAAGTYDLEFSEQFASLSKSGKVEKLEQLQMAMMEAQLREGAEVYRGTAQGLYFQSKVDLMDGNLAAAKVHLLELREQTEASSDPQTQALYQDASTQLKVFALSQLQQLDARNELLNQQRDSHLFKKSGYKVHYKMNQRLIAALRLRIQSGNASTLGEALTQLSNEERAVRTRVGMTKPAPCHWATKGLPPLTRIVNYYESLDLVDPQFKLLLEFESRAALEKRMDPDSRPDELLSAARGLRARNGSYQVAGEIYQDLFAEALAVAREEIPQAEIDSIGRDVRNGFTQYKIKEEIKERLATLKAEQPLVYQERFPQGSPSRQDLNKMVAAATASRIDLGIEKEAFQILDHRVQSGAVGESSVRTAWSEYRDMLDPIDEWDNFADATWDAILDEVIVTALTLPVTMGAGAAVRGAISGSRWALRASSASRLGNFGVRSLSFTAGSLTEGLVMELQMASFTGELRAKHVGYNVVMSAAFHGGGKLWGRYAQELGVDVTAQQLARAEGRLWSMHGMRAVDTIGTLGTQTFLGAALADPSNQQDMGAQLAASLARNLGFHYGVRTVRSLAQPVSKSKSTPPQYGSKEFLTDTRDGLAFLWNSAEQALFGSKPRGGFPQLAMATVGSAPGRAGKVGPKGRSSQEPGFFQGLLQVFQTNAALDSSVVQSASAGTKVVARRTAGPGLPSSNATPAPELSTKQAREGVRFLLHRMRIRRGEKHFKYQMGEVVQVEVAPSMALADLPYGIRFEKLTIKLPKEAREFVGRMDGVMGSERVINADQIRPQLSPADQKLFDLTFQRASQRRQIAGRKAFLKATDEMNTEQRQAFYRSVHEITQLEPQAARQKMKVLSESLTLDQWLNFEQAYRIQTQGKLLPMESFLQQVRRDSGLKRFPEMANVRLDEAATGLAYSLDKQGMGKGVVDGVDHREFYVKGSARKDSETGRYELTVHINKVRTQLAPGPDNRPRFKWRRVDEDITIEVKMTGDNVAMFDLREFGGAPAANDNTPFVPVSRLPKPEAPKMAPRARRDLHSTEAQGPAIFRLDGGSVEKY